MQQLHLVGFTTDHKGLILGTRRGTQEGSFVVTLDRALVEQIEELLRLQGGEAGTGESAAAGNGTSPLLRRPKAESRLTPREVQALLRTGRSVSEVAEAAAMSEDWVGRFAPPVLAEQARVVERATGLTYSKPRIGPSIQPLGESVVWNLAERGVVLSGPAVDDAWSAFQQPDGGWVVRVSYLAERRRQHADWTVDMVQGVLKALNRLGNELGYVEPGRRRPQALPPATPVSASAQRAAAAPPKLAPPPPLPPRPTGRLSLLGTSAGVTRHGSSSSKATGRARDVAPGATSGREASKEPEVAGTSVSPEPAVPDPAAPEPGVRGDEPGVPAPESDANAQAAQQRRPRPLRPLSAASDEVSSPPERSRPVRPPSADPTSDEAPPPPARSRPPEQPGADPGGSAATPRPRRERPIRAPSRIRRDELADPPPVVTRRSVASPKAVPPRNDPSGPRGYNAAGSSPSPGAPGTPASGLDPIVHRFGPAHSAAERTVSTAERFGVGRSGQTALASKPAPTSRPAPPGVGAVPDPLPEPGTDIQPAPALERRFGASRPLRARRLAPEPDLEPDDEFAPEFMPEAERGPSADEVYHAFADLEADDPVTAPVPVVDALDQDHDFDAADGAGGPDAPGAPGDMGGQVLIRTGQAGSTDRAPGDAPGKSRSGADGRPSRPGRIKLRRRPQGSP